MHKNDHAIFDISRTSAPDAVAALVLPVAEYSPFRYPLADLPRIDVFERVFVFRSWRRVGAVHSLTDVVVGSVLHPSVPHRVVVRNHLDATLQCQLFCESCECEDGEKKASGAVGCGKVAAEKVQNDRLRSRHGNFRYGKPTSIV